VLGKPNIDRQTRRKQETRGEILEAAWAIVREGGWETLTLRAVAARVGMRAPSLYGHFSSKLDIVDAMFGLAWADYDAAAAALEDGGLPDEPRKALEVTARLWLDTMAADPERSSLMNQRPVPGFTPSAASYSAAVASLDRLQRLLAQLGIPDPDATDLWTAVLAGLVSQQNANDPGGQRWRRLLPRAVHMYAAEVGLGEHGRNRP
jgi:AcrR family transcriptional regulator